jgi:hypothetical protein
MEKADSDAYQKVVYDLAQQSGLRFQVRNSYGLTDIDSTLRIAISLPPDPGIAALAAAAPQVQFLAINMPSVQAGGNVSTLAGDSRFDVPAFVAGYAAALIGDDFRVGMILPRDNPTARQAATAFANGMAYHCGLCQGFRYYYDASGGSISYPRFAEVPPDESPTNMGGWVSYLVGGLSVDALYVFPDSGIQVPEFYAALGQSGAQIIGTTLPNPRPGGWVMTIQGDPVRAIQAAWPELLAGTGGQVIPSPLGVADIDPAYLSPGKQRLVQKVLDDLQAGRLSTGFGQ